MNSRAQYFEQAVATQGGAAGPRSFASRAPSQSGKAQSTTAAEPDILYTEHLTVRYTRKYDQKIHELSGVGFWRPNTPAGWSRFGDATVIKDPEKSPVLIVKDDATYLAKPTGFKQLWGDAKATVWELVPPDGYVAVGFAVNPGTNQPDAGLYRCVRQDLVLRGEFELIGKAVENGEYRQGFYLVKYNGTEPFLPINGTVFGSFEKNPPRFVPSPNGARPPERPGYACKPWVLKSLTAAEVYDDVLEGFKHQFETRLQGSGKALASGIAADPALKDRFKDVAAKVALATTTAQAPRASAPPTLATLTPKPAPVSTGAASLARVSKYVAPVAARPPGRTDGLIGMANPFNYTWSPGGTFTAENTAPTRLLTDIPGLNQVPFLQSVQLTDAVVTQGKIATGPEANQPFIIARGNVTVTFDQPIGQIQGRAIALSRLFRRTGVQTGLLVLVPTDRLRAVAHLNESPINQLGLPAMMAVTYGTAAHEWESAELPADVLAELQPVSAAGWPLRFRKDVSLQLKAGLNRAGRLDTVLGSVSTEALFTGILKGPTNDKFRLVTEPLGDFKPGFLPPGLDISAPALDLVPGDMDLGLSAMLKLNVADALKVELPIRLGLANTVHLSADFPGTWTNPLDIPSLELSGMKFDGGLGVGAPTFNLKARAQFLGKALDMAGGFTFGPLTLSMFSAQGVNLSLADLINFQHQLVRAVAPGPLPDFKVNIPDNLIEIRNAAITVAAQPVPSMKIEQGTTVAGELFITGTKVGSANVRTSPNNGLRIQAETIGWSLGPIALTGSGGRGGPKLDLLYWPLKEPPYSLEQHCYLSGQARVANAPLDALIFLDRQRVSVNLHGKIAGVFDASVTGQADGAIDDFRKLNDMTMTASFSESLVEALEQKVSALSGQNEAVKLALKLVGSAIFRVKSASFTTPYSNLNAGGNVNLAVTCSILGTDVSLTPTIPLTPTGYESLAGELAKAVIEEATKFRNPWDTAWKGVEAAATAAADTAKKTYEETSKAVTAAMQTTVKDVADATTKVADAASKAADAAKNVGGKVVGGVSDAGRSLGLW